YADDVFVGHHRTTERRQAAVAGRTRRSTGAARRQASRAVWIRRKCNVFVDRAALSRSTAPVQSRGPGMRRYLGRHAEVRSGAGAVIDRAVPRDALAMGSDNVHPD